MVDPSFERLPLDKKKRIIEGALREFAASGYETASTNRIVEEVGISKGSLFHYFGSKEELWLHVAEHVFSSVASLMKDRVRNLPSDLLERLRLLAEIMLDFYVENPLAYRFFLGILAPGASSLQRELLSRVGKTFDLDSFFIGVETSRFRTDRASPLLLVKWLFSGIKHELFELDELRTDPSRMKEEFLSRLDQVLIALASGVYA